MTTHELAILRERDVTFDQSCAHAGRGSIRLLGVLRVFQWSPAVPDGKSGGIRRLSRTTFQPLLQRARLHRGNQVSDAYVSWPRRARCRGWRGGTTRGGARQREDDESRRVPVT